MRPKKLSTLPSFSLFAVVAVRVNGTSPLLNSLFNIKLKLYERPL